MSRSRIIRVGTEGLDKVRRLVAALPEMRFAPTEGRTHTDRQLIEMGLGWLAGRLESAVYTRAELERAAVETLRVYIAGVNGIDVADIRAGAEDGRVTLRWEKPDGTPQEHILNFQEAVHG